jgi:drug/metabolite transporter (DMT)-like permease
VFASLLDWLIWGTLPDAVFAVGALLVAGAAVLALRMRDRPAEVAPAEG